jgi:hypothetical protein
MGAAHVYFREISGFAMVLHEFWACGKTVSGV